MIKYDITIIFFTILSTLSATVSILYEQYDILVFTAVYIMITVSVLIFRYHTWHPCFFFSMICALLLLIVGSMWGAIQAGKITFQYQIFIFINVSVMCTAACYSLYKICFMHKKINTTIQNTV
jgi:hypothetical protein